jgi:Helix-turn-helix domain
MIDPNRLKHSDVLPTHRRRLETLQGNGDLGSAWLSEGRSNDHVGVAAATVPITAPHHREAVTVRLRLLDTAEDWATQADLITTEELATLLRVDPSSVRRWRTARPIQGPPFIQLSERVIMYAIEDVRDWLISRRVRPEAA